MQHVIEVYVFKLIVKAERVKEICEQIGFPITVNENISVTDAFRSATGESNDRIEELYGSDIKGCRIYCRDNKRTDADMLSRELVEETLYESTNSYNTVMEDNYFGIPMIVNVFRDDKNKTLPLDFVKDFDPPSQGFKIIEYIEGEDENEE